MSRLQVAAFYAFTPLNEQQRASLLSDLPDMAITNSVLGSILVAHEGVNGTISGPESGVEALLQSLRTSLALGCEHFERLEVKRSWADQAVFRRFKARAKKEIVTMGVTSVNPRQNVGTYVDPKDWNDLVDDPDTLVIDTRNSYETAIGSFEGSLDPGTDSFRDFPAWAEASLRPLVNDKAATYKPRGLVRFTTSAAESSTISGRSHNRKPDGRASVSSSTSALPSTISWNPVCTACATPVAFRFHPAIAPTRATSKVCSASIA